MGYRLMLLVFELGVCMVELPGSGFAVTSCTVHHLIRFEGLHGAVTPCTVHHLLRFEGLRGGDTR